MEIWRILVEIGLSVITTLLAFLLKEQIKENKKIKREAEESHTKRESSLEEGVVCILRKHLMDEHETWTVKGYITPKALESSLLMYKAYKGLGGNGMIDHMEDEIQELPIKE